MIFKVLTHPDEPMESCYVVVLTVNDRSNNMPSLYLGCG